MLKKIKTALYAAVPTSVAAVLTAGLAGGWDWKLLLGAGLGPFVPVAGAYLKAEPLADIMLYLGRHGIPVEIVTLDEDL